MTAPVLLQLDASDYGLGVALLQPSTEQRYAQIEKECLAIVEAFNKFDQWLLGKADITVHTDHQPLQSIFQKDLASAPKRLQKMMLFLQRYNFTVAYRKGSSLHLADTLSRAPCRGEATTPSILTPSKSSARISHSWILPRRPSQMTLASDSAEPPPHAKRCSHCHTI